MKVFINFKFVEGAFGGGNQFLKALSGEFSRRGVLTADLKDADIVLINSFQHMRPLLERAEDWRKAVVVHRIDGPEQLRDQALSFRDNIIREFNDVLADATVFQSEWSRKENLAKRIGRTPVSACILNAPDPAIFYSGEKDPFMTGRKIRLVAVSWSPNKIKGFSMYRWMDEHLDFNRFEMLFIGNTPVPFRHIQVQTPLPSRELADVLRKQDIYIAASKNEPCSNALLEAMHCGLPVVALKSGSHPQIVAGAGEMFEMVEDVPELLEKICLGHASYVAKIALPSIGTVAGQYLVLMEEVLAARHSGILPLKSRAPWDLSRLRGALSAMDRMDVLLSKWVSFQRKLRRILWRF